MSMTGVASNLAMVLVCVPMLPVNSGMAEVVHIPALDIRAGRESSEVARLKHPGELQK